MIQAQERLQGVKQMIDDEQYFVIHAARQSGKTTCLMDLTQRLNAERKYYALYCSLEGLQGITDVKDGIPALVRTIKKVLLFSDIPKGNEFAKNADYDDFTNVLNIELTLFCKSLDKALVIFFDEADCLSETTLISFLRQIRNGYNSRAVIPFVHSLALVGMRNIRDFKVRVRPDSDTLGSASPFNIVKRTLTISNFTKEDIEYLYAQHTTESGQIFEPEAIDLVWKKTQGQPWLVNAIACEVIEILLNNDYSKAVTAELCTQAIQSITLRRDVHIDSLLERLKEPRVRRVIEPLLLGEFVNTDTDDFYYTRDLGLVRITEEGNIAISNPIYTEVIVRTLNAESQERLRQTKETYQMPRYFKGEQIDMDFLMADFQQFWRENSAIWVERFQYKEAAPHLILMAFLQRIINGGGNIIREPAAGKGRLDLCVVYKDKKYPIEIKIRYNNTTLEKGLVQLAEYMDVFGEQHGWLCIFDRSIDKSWEDKIHTEKHETKDGKTITIVGL
jgi:hypothetical protein